MAILRSKDASKMSGKELAEKIRELRIEIVKSKSSAKKTGKLNPKEIRKTIARLLTFENRLKALKEVK